MKIEDFEIIKLETVDSTNDYLKRLVKKGESKPKIVISDIQTNGKGTKNRSFVSEKGGIYLSILLPYFDASFITPMTAVAVSDTIDKFATEKTKIKWVNDIYLKNKKVCGILCESVYSDFCDKPFIIVGIGINLFKPEKDFAAKIKNIAISIFDYEDKAVKERFVSLLINNFLFYFNGLDKKTFLEKYRNNNLVIGKRVKVFYDNKEREGIAVEVDSECRLKVKFSESEEKLLSSGDVILKK